MAQTLILGVGNPLFGDDGFGIEAVRTMQLRPEFAGVAEIVDGGTAGIYLLPYLENREHVILVDAVKFGGAPGEVVSADAETVPAQIGAKLSEHQVTLHDVLALLDLLGTRPKRMRVIGVEPASLRFAEPLSDPVRQAMPEVFRLVAEELAYHATDQCAVSAQ